MAFTGIRKPLSKLSIQNKLLVINLTATTAALLFSAAMVVLGGFIEKRDFMMESLQVQADMVSENTTAALVFNDRQGAEDVLHAFASASDIHVAIIYDKEDVVLASYIRTGMDIKISDINELYRQDRATNKGTHLHDETAALNDKIHIVKDIKFENETIGTLFIQADISNLYSNLIKYLIYTGIVSLIGLALASLLLLKLRKSITRPILELSTLMDKVIQKNDYSLRTTNKSGDEIGILSQGFNKMLAHIQINDEKLAHELSERYRAEEYLDKLAYYDVTTDLPNRHYFHQQLDRAVEHAVSTKKKMVLLFLDLDNFKIVNDTLGHKTGDLLLKQASARLSNVLRQNDYICRIGGDEFAIIIENISNIEDVSIVTEKCIECLTNPFVFDDHKFYIGVSIGISICPDDTVNANSLLVNADMAMYNVKLRGKNSYQFFNNEMNEAHSRKYQLESDLRFAIKEGQMELYYQPQVNSQNGLLTGAEALMRWHHPEKGLIFPDEFIPIAEETGLILSLGDWLIKTACHHGKLLVDSGLKDITIAINISGLQIREDTFIDNISAALTKSELDPSHLELELTETILMDDITLVINKVTQLKDLGVHVAIDDFGTGFSSMSYLKSFPITKLKIDMSFISGLPQSSEDMAITRAIIAMAHGMNIKVVAEGVEHEDQVDFLRSHACDVLQGYYYAKPMPFNEFLQLKDVPQKSYSKLRIV